MKKNISIISLINNFKKDIAKKLADELEMIFADVNDLMEYNLINDEMLAVAGQEYYDKNEQKTLKTISSYENTVLTINFSTLNKSNNFDILKNNSLIIYLAFDFTTFCQLNKQEFNKTLIKLNQIAYNDRDTIMKSYADIIVNVTDINLDNVLKQLLIAINGYYKI